MPANKVPSGNVKAKSSESGFRRQLSDPPEGNIHFELEPEGDTQYCRRESVPVNPSRTRLKGRPGVAAVSTRLDRNTIRAVA
jgi:hypothetical protein